MLFTEPGDPTTICQRHSEFKGERYDFCSNGCKWIFDREPEKYVQAWLPVHQIYQGNCGGPTVPDVLAWYGLQPGDNGEYHGSAEEQDWIAWHSTQPAEAADSAESAEEPSAAPVAGN
jgi:phenol hydroxylase P3 protein